MSATLQHRPQISETEAEHIADQRVWRELARDREYRHAENSEDQAVRESEIGAAVWADIEQRYEVV